MTQTIWIQDFPLKSNKREKNEIENDFEETLVNFWDSLSCSLPNNWIKKYDFSKTNVELVTSIPGTHKNKDLKKYGHMRIRYLNEKYNLKKIDNSLYFQISSIGKLNDIWINDILNSFHISNKKNLNIIFPTFDTVEKSKFGKKKKKKILIQKRFKWWRFFF
jgi:tyrosyl-DNA phosphodiesterase 1